MSPVSPRFPLSVLESQGIKTSIKNRDLVGLAGEAAIMPDVWPALCVVEDVDYDRAMQEIRENISYNAESVDVEVGCPACSEVNPGNFDLCW